MTSALREAAGGTLREGLLAPGSDVEPHVVDAGSGSSASTAATKASRRSAGRRSRCEPRITVAGTRAGRRARHARAEATTGRRSNPSRSEPLSVSAGEAKFHGPFQPARRGRPGAASRPRDGGDVALAAALGDEPAAGLSAACRRSKSRSWSAIQWKVAVERIASTGSSSSSSVGRQAHVDGRAEPRARLLDHRRRAVDGDHLAAREPLEQRRRHPAGAAAGVEHALVAAQLEPVEHVATHRLERRRHALVGRGVPVTRRHTSVRHRSRHRARAARPRPRALDQRATSAAGWRHCRARRRRRSRGRSSGRPTPTRTRWKSGEPSSRCSDLQAVVAGQAAAEPRRGRRRTAGRSRRGRRPRGRGRACSEPRAGPTERPASFM